MTLFAVMQRTIIPLSQLSDQLMFGAIASFKTALLMGIEERKCTFGAFFSTFLFFIFSNAKFFLKGIFAQVRDMQDIGMRDIWECPTHNPSRKVLLAGFLSYVP